MFDDDRSLYRGWAGIEIKRAQQAPPSPPAQAHHRRAGTHGAKPAARHRHQQERT